MVHDSESHFRPPEIQVNIRNLVRDYGEYNGQSLLATVCRELTSDWYGTRNKSVPR